MPTNYHYLLTAKYINIILSLMAFQVVVFKTKKIYMEVESHFKLLVVSTVFWRFFVSGRYRVSVALDVYC